MSDNGDRELRTENLTQVFCNHKGNLQKICSFKKYHANKTTQKISYYYSHCRGGLHKRNLP